MKTALLLIALVSGVSAASAQQAPESVVYRQHLARASAEERRLIVEVLVACHRALKATSAIPLHAGTCEDSYLRWQLLFGGNPDLGSPRAITGGALGSLSYSVQRRAISAGHYSEKEPTTEGLAIVRQFTTAFLTSTP